MPFNAFREACLGMDARKCICRAIAFFLQAVNLLGLGCFHKNCFAEEMRKLFFNFQIKEKRDIDYNKLFFCALEFFNAGFDFGKNKGVQEFFQKRPFFRIGKNNLRYFLFFKGREMLFQEFFYKGLFVKQGDYCI